MTLGLLGVGNTTVAVSRGIGYFVAGTNGARQTGSDKYNMSTDGVSSGGSISTGTSDGAGVGNTTVAVLMGGSTGAIVATVNKYTYSGDSVAAGTSLSVATYVNNAVTSATVAYSLGGNQGGGSVTTVYKYTYSSDALASGTALQTTSGQGSSGMQITAKGFACCLNGANTSTVTPIYTYSGDTTSDGAALSATSWQNMATINTSTTGYAFGGYRSGAINDGNKYNISGNSWSATTNLGTPRYNPGAAGDGTGGIIASGDNPLGTHILTTDKFTYSGVTMGSGTSLGTARTANFSWSNSPQI